MGYADSTPWNILIPAANYMFKIHCNMTSTTKANAVVMPMTMRKGWKKNSGFKTSY